MPCSALWVRVRAEVHLPSRGAPVWSMSETFHLQYAVKSNVIVIATLADIALNSLCDYSDNDALPSWYPAVILGYARYSKNRCNPSSSRACRPAAGARCVTLHRSVAGIVRAFQGPAVPAGAELPVRLPAAGVDVRV